MNEKRLHILTIAAFAAAAFMAGYMILTVARAETFLEEPGIVARTEYVENRFGGYRNRCFVYTETGLYCIDAPPMYHLQRNDPVTLTVRYFAGRPRNATNIIPRE